MSSGKLPTFSDVSGMTGKERSKANLRKGGGRPKGVANKNTKALKDMILGALNDVGGQEYLVEQAENNPGAFLSLIAKVLPVELQNKHEGTLTISVVTGIERADG